MLTHKIHIIIKNIQMRFYLFLLFYALPYLAFGQGTLQDILTEMAKSPFYLHANLGIAVQDVTDRKVIADINKDKLFIPASTIKLITTLSARHLLGENYRFTTGLYYDGNITDEGTLQGNIYIIGNGDPTLGSSRISGNPTMEMILNIFAERITQAGIRCIEGEVIAIAKENMQPPIGDSWQWNDLGNYYATGAWSINVNENLYNIYYNHDMEPGEKAQISYIEPYIPRLMIESHVTTDSAHTADNAYIFGAPFTYDRFIKGTIPQGKGLFKIKGSIPNPPLFFAYRLYALLHHMGISVDNYNTESTKKDGLTCIFEHSSPPLKDIIKITNDQSNNLYAEATLKALGGKDITENVQIMLDNLQSMGLDTYPFNMEDGSGLSPRNLISPDLMASFLAKQSQYLGDVDFKNILPTVGESGTVKNMLGNSPAKGRMWIKSGSMEKILCYAGYARAASGRLITFAVFLNNSQAKTFKENKTELEKIIDTIYRFS